MKDTTHFMVELYLSFMGTTYNSIFATLRYLKKYGILVEKGKYFLEGEELMVKRKKGILILMLPAVFLGVIAVLLVSQAKAKKETPNTLLEQEKIEEVLEEPKSVKQEEQSEDLFEAYYEQAEELLQTMTLEEKIGQMFLARFPENEVIEEIQNHHPGGYLLFERDFKEETKESIKQKLEQCQQASKIKLILGVDEEGGTVTRVSTYPAFRSSAFLSPQELWQKGKLPAILQDSTEKTKLLKSLGLNMNLTPVADVPTQEDSFMYARSYGRGAEKTAIYVAKLTQRMNQDGMISAMKHFPGYGDNVDTHKEMAIDTRPYETFEKTDFLPFMSGIEAKGPCVLMSHNVVTSMDAEKPASLSAKVHHILREELNFSGIILTDDLAMEAVSGYVQSGDAAVQAVLVGNDMIISSDFVGQKQEVLDAVKQGKIKEEQINQAVKRILAWKHAYQII